MCIQTTSPKHSVHELKLMLAGPAFSGPVSFPSHEESWCLSAGERAEAGESDAADDVPGHAAINVAAAAMAAAT